MMTLPFLSTLSLRRATTAFQKLMAALLQFLSTLSLRRATKELALAAKNAVFLSTLSLRRATSRVTVAYTASTISIHALLAESDQHKQVGI